LEKRRKAEIATDDIQLILNIILAMTINGFPFSWE
jgi:hypothetical protein